MWGLSSWGCPVTRLAADVAARNLDRARHFYRDRGLSYVFEPTEFHIFAPSGAASGRSTELGFEVEDIDQAVANLRSGFAGAVCQAPDPVFSLRND
jgi:catechol 2,3-dioxygenase-like lactoylglutathione lyase family enzyme